MFSACRPIFSEVARTT